MHGRWLAIAAGCFVVTSTGCDAWDALSEPPGVCEYPNNPEPLCYEAPDGSNRAQRWCDNPTGFVEGVTCADLGYTLLCKENSDNKMTVYAESPEGCASMNLGLSPTS